MSYAPFHVLQQDPSTEEPRREAGPFRKLLVMSQRGVQAHALPEKGEITIGRGSNCNITLDDGRASRRHAVLYMGDVCEVEDTGSRNGTMLEGESLSAGERASITPGMYLTIGNTVLVLQESSDKSEAPRVFSADAFEERVRACRAESLASGEPYGILRVDVDATIETLGRRTDLVREGHQLLERMEAVLCDCLRPVDVIGLTAFQRYELLLPATDEVRTGEVAALVALQLEHASIRATVEVVHAAARKSARLRAKSSPSEATLVTRGRFQEAIESLVVRVAASDINVLVLGETGVGKEVLARELHTRSPRSSRPLVSINCGAVAESLLESELFGHEKGSFTGAQQTKAGLLESAEGGTVFLDEVGEMSLPLQAKLLRVLEQREVLRVGALRPRAIDVRFVAATNRDLEQEVSAGRFRQDLYFRLNGIAILVPPLRERLDEVEGLAIRFVEEAAARSRRAAPTIEPAVFEALRSRAWPGNIRELRNVMERAVLLCDKSEITREDVSSRVLGGSFVEPSRAVLPEGDERTRVVAALAACHGNQTQAAKLLGVSRRTLVYRLQEFGLPRPRKREP